MKIWVGVIGLLFACLAQAHERSESTSHWTLINGDLHGVVTARTREVTRLTVPGDNYASLAQIFAAHVGRSVEASIDGVACTPRQRPAILESEPGFVRVDVRMHCGAGGSLSLKVDLFFAVAPSHHHFLYVATGSASREAILSVSAPSTEVDLRPSSGDKTHFLQFVEMGIEHIATGIDHLAFLLALLIAARTARQVLAIVTGFTVGHSITLSLAVLGVIQANRGAVECLIGLTIALAAAQNLIRGEREGRIAGIAAAVITASLLLIPADLRADMPAGLILAIALATGSAVWVASMGGAHAVGRTKSPPFSTPARFTMAAGFGLIHGLGFASALQDLHLPRGMLLSSLLGFNVGVELGQLAVVIAAVALIAIAGRLVHMTQRRAEMSAAMASAVLLAAGLAWFLTRAY
ncbi:MAG: HupE/UreJ family protein [Proteobacteria bacterium]|nr:HupE/UreJ family protein [Pseudomonadota bacterium]